MSQSGFILKVGSLDIIYAKSKGVTGLCRWPHRVCT